MLNSLCVLVVVIARVARRHGRSASATATGPTSDIAYPIGPEYAKRGQKSALALFPGGCGILAGSQGGDLDSTTDTKPSGACRDGSESR